MSMDKETAFKTLKTIQKTQQDLMAQGREAEARGQNLQKKVEDLEKAHRALNERNFTAPAPHGGDRKLASYVDQESGDIQWGSTLKTVTLPGEGPVQVVKSGLLDEAVPADQWHADLMRKVTDRNLARMMMKSPSTPHLDADIIEHLKGGPPGIRQAVEKRIKAFYDDGAAGSSAGPLIPDEYIPEVYQEYNVPTRLRRHLTRVQVSRETILKPRITQGARPYIKGRITTDNPADYTPSTPNHSLATINISGLAVRVVADDASVEDSAVAGVPMLRRELIRAADDGFEDAIINGDSAASHQDAIGSWNIRGRWGASGLGGAADHRRLMKGWRAAAADQSTTLDLSGTMSAANFAALMALLGERGVANLLGWVSPEAMVTDFLTLTEVKTMDVFGNDATVKTGALAMFMGVPLEMTRYQSADLAATGLYTGSGALTGCGLVDLDAYQLYTRRGGVVEMSKDIKSGAIDIVFTIREVMDTPDTSSAKNVAYGYNL